MEFDPLIPNILPHLRVYSLQIGYKLFKLSGASLSSDGPSYFTKYFLTAGNEDKTLFVDRNPVVFEYIYNHLQGYHISIPPCDIYMQLWLDSIYFQLKRLRTLLKDEGIPITIGDQRFVLPQALLMETGNYPNYFSVSLESVYHEDYQLVERLKVIRPPPQRAITVPHRSSKLFDDLMEVLRGNTTALGDKHHRRLLVRECRYYRFQELEQRIINCKISPNNYYENKQDILIDLLDVATKGVISVENSGGKEKHVQYTRPHVKKERKSNLIVQIEPSYCEVLKKLSYSAKLVLNRELGLGFVRLSGPHCSKFMQIFDLHADLAPVENTEDGPAVMVFAGLANAVTTINGKEMLKNWAQELMGKPLRTDGEQLQPESKKRKHSEDVKGNVFEFTLINSTWRVFATEEIYRLQGVAIEAVTDEASFNKETSEFL